ncbi:hypothetical protein [Verticiella sediminum]|uniref:hypothetical protein n=1 Tax=Verticiella sediminum TaxID=1247510 RepID=UPI0033747978
MAKAISPDDALGSRVAPLGLWFYRGRSLPEKYHGGAFVSNHGSWDRNPLSGYDVVFVRFRDGKPEGGSEPTWITQQSSVCRRRSVLFYAQEHSDER